MSFHLPFAVLATVLIAASAAMAQDQLATNVTTQELKTDSLERPGTVTGRTSRERPLAGTAPTLLATSLIGQTIFGRDGKPAGIISDVVMTHDFDGLLAVVGVGGFWGFGTHDVAIPKDRISVSGDGSGGLRLTVQTTREQMQQAPVFDRTALMR